MSRFLEFSEIRDTGKTKVYQVVSKKWQIALGEIKWFGRWRQYTFFPNLDTVFNVECLHDICGFISDLHKKRLRNKR